MLEYVTIGLAVISGIAGAIAYIYRRGRTDGIDTACEQRIKEDIQSIGVKVDDMKEEGDKVHSEIVHDMKELNSKVDQIKGSTDVIRTLFQQHIGTTKH